MLLWPWFWLFIRFKGFVFNLTMLLGTMPPLARVTNQPPLTTLGLPPAPDSRTLRIFFFFSSDMFNPMFPGARPPLARVTNQPPWQPCASPLLQTQDWLQTFSLWGRWQEMRPVQCWRLHQLLQLQWQLQRFPVDGSNFMNTRWMKICRVFFQLNPPHPTKENGKVNLG